MQRSFAVLLPRPDGAFAAKYPALSHLPYILDFTRRFHRLANAYLVDRGLGLWSPRSKPGEPIPLIPTERSMLNYAQWLVNFLEWADKRGVDITTCSYVAQVQGQYQDEMLKGIWSQRGTPCKPSTVNLRITQACEFLSWMVARGKRGAFAVPYESVRISLGSATSFWGHLGKEVQSRKGKVRAEPTVLQLPSDVEVREWLKRTRAARGETAELICESILLTAIRREELVCLRTNTLPENPNDWEIVNPLEPVSKQQVHITIRFGTKGKSYGKDRGDKIGPPRSIHIPLLLANKWHQYRRTLRNRAFSQRVKGIPNKEKRIAAGASAVHLFLREDNGQQYSGKRVYDDWVASEKPVPEWSPHSGRHWWACSVLWRGIQRHEYIHKLGGGHEVAAALLESTAMSIIRLEIQPQLGHADQATTMRYLRWVMSMVSAPLSLEDDAATATWKSAAQ